MLENRHTIDARADLNIQKIDLCILNTLIYY